MLFHHTPGRLLSAAAIVMLSASVYNTQAQTAQGRNIAHQEEQILREVHLIDVQKNTVSNVELYTANNGVFGNNTAAGAGGGFWPRGSNNQYIFGGGIWFGAQKWNEMDMGPGKVMAISYNPYTATSWMVPGLVADSDTLERSADAIQKNAVYFSTDYSAGGITTDGSGRANWPVWHAQPGKTPGIGGYAGDYIPDVAMRTTAHYPAGPVMLSGEDIVTVYKDTDIGFYFPVEDSAFARIVGYPIRAEVVQTLYTWGEGDLKDVVVMQYELTNRSTDTLYDCWFAPVMDFDLTVSGSSTGGLNDRARYYNEDPSLDLALQWTDTDQGEAGAGFGYVGMSFITSPAVDENNFLRTDKPLYSREEQLGLITFHHSPEDPVYDYMRYNLMSIKTLDSENGPDDKRFLMATGPFHLLPGQEVKIAAALVFARGSKGGECDGTTDDLTNLVELTKKARQKYEQQLYGGVVDVHEQASENSGMFTIGKLSPNPVSDMSRLEIHMLEPAPVVVEIVDATGRILLTMERSLDRGTHVVQLDASSLPQGVYLCRVATGGATQSVLFAVVR